MVTHQPKDGHPPKGFILQTRNLALRLNSQNRWKMMEFDTEELILVLSNLISECLHNQIICTKNFTKFLFQVKKWEQFQNCHFHQYQHIFAVAGGNHPYMISISIMVQILNGNSFIDFPTEALKAQPQSFLVFSNAES